MDVIRDFFQIMGNILVTLMAMNMYSILTRASAQCLRIFEGISLWSAAPLNLSDDRPSYEVLIQNDSIHIQ